MLTKAERKLLDEIEIDKAIAEAEADYAANGILLDGDEVLEQLRKKHLGSERVLKADHRPARK